METITIKGEEREKRRERVKEEEKNQEETSHGSPTVSSKLLPQFLCSGYGARGSNSMKMKTMLQLQVSTVVERMMVKSRFVDNFVYSFVCSGLDVSTP